ncbi:hypothetical protein GYH30_004821 [Glycine max]|nr:hypothetical protein GYH30_004821 [Glycine max]
MHDVVLAANKFDGCEWVVVLGRGFQECNGDENLNGLLYAQCDDSVELACSIFLFHLWFWRGVRNPKSCEGGGQF